MKKKKRVEVIFSEKHYNIMLNNASKYGFENISDYLRFVGINSKVNSFTGFNNSIIPTIETLEQMKNRGAITQDQYLNLVAIEVKRGEKKD